MTKPSFEQENAMLFAKLEEFAAELREQSSKVTSLNQRITGLKFELDKLKEENDKLKQQNNFLKLDKERVKEEAQNLVLSEGQNFSFLNKITKIVTDIDSQEVSEEKVRELIDLTIGEIDDCIRLLKDK